MSERGHRGAQFPSKRLTAAAGVLLAVVILAAARLAIPAAFPAGAHAAATAGTHAAATAGIHAAAPAAKHAAVTAGTQQAATAGTHAAAPAAEQPGGSCAAAGRSPCVIELHGPQAPSISPDCLTDPWSRYLKFMLPGRLADSDKNGWWETVVEVALDPAKECGCVKLRIHFQDPVGGWSFNVGDSPTNNGYGGDAGTTNYAAEMFITKGSLLNVCTAASPKFGALRFDKILEWTLPLLGGRHADVEVCDQVLAFDMPGAFAGNRPLHWKLQTPTTGVLYSFAPRPGLPEPEGVRKDKGLYAGFNRVIHEADKTTTTSGPRLGTGVQRVEITVSP